ncbi:hypothetical protein BZG35_09510 [Brevundimonas sp. LM2]|nr:hypothetical protein BZG35_09510 [Brevundimonas sp. LM2]
MSFDDHSRKGAGQFIHERLAPVSRVSGHSWLSRQMAAVASPTCDVRLMASHGTAESDVGFAVAAAFEAGRRVH